jgi:hypothetical protein
MRKTNKLKFCILFILILILLPSTLAWWNTDWNYKQLIELQVSSGSTPSNYQVLLNLNTAHLGSHFDWNNQCKDLRFINAAETVILPYWIESCTSSAISVWVKVDTQITTTPSTIYLYHGNPAATSLSNKDNVLDFYDEFNGNTKFSQHNYPYGDPHPCGYPSYVRHKNNGQEQYLEIGCYDEGELRASPNLPFANYKIEIEYRTGSDPHGYAGARYTHYDEQYGAGVTVPSRIISVNNQKIYESAGKKSNFAETKTITHSGLITNLHLSVSTAGSAQTYYTYYDYIRITKYHTVNPTYAIQSEEPYEIDLCEGITCTEAQTDCGDGNIMTCTPTCDQGVCGTCTPPACPCDGVTCDNYCTGTIFSSNGHCSNGNCIYDNELTCENGCEGNSCKNSCDVNCVVGAINRWVG